eukprot:TRINITY_DN539_c0_g1_i4.p1 TRINITY_DN539_c0_g1~~TRINITY_DN539_c0_g1_i4.p1  ORF type:complete len:1408 (-),score=441.14 TRINITY_DN539_c0_g1_i4:86-4309(-)
MMEVSQNLSQHHRDVFKNVSIKVRTVMSFWHNLESKHALKAEETAPKTVPVPADVVHFDDVCQPDAVLKTASFENINFRFNQTDDDSSVGDVEVCDDGNIGCLIAEQSNFESDNEGTISENEKPEVVDIVDHTNGEHENGEVDGVNNIRENDEVAELMNYHQVTDKVVDHASDEVVDAVDDVDTVVDLASDEVVDEVDTVVDLASDEVVDAVDDVDTVVDLASDEVVDEVDTVVDLASDEVVDAVDDVETVADHFNDGNEVVDIVVDQVNDGNSNVDAIDDIVVVSTHSTGSILDTSFEVVDDLKTSTTKISRSDLKNEISVSSGIFKAIFGKTVPLEHTIGAILDVSDGDVDETEVVPKKSPEKEIAAVGNIRDQHAGRRCMPSLFGNREMYYNRFGNRAKYGIDSIRNSKATSSDNMDESLHDIKDSTDNISINDKETEKGAMEKDIGDVIDDNISINDKETEKEEMVKDIGDVILSNLDDSDKLQFTTEVVIVDNPLDSNSGENSIVNIKENGPEQIENGDTIAHLNNLEQDDNQLVIAIVDDELAIDVENASSVVSNENEPDMIEILPVDNSSSIIKENETGEIHNSDQIISHEDNIEDPKQNANTSIEDISVKREIKSDEYISSSSEEESGSYSSSYTDNEIFSNGPPEVQLFRTRASSIRRSKSEAAVQHTESESEEEVRIWVSAQIANNGKRENLLTGSRNNTINQSFIASTSSEESSESIDYDDLSEMQRGIQIRLKINKKLDKYSKVRFNDGDKSQYVFKNDKIMGSSLHKWIEKITDDEFYPQSKLLYAFHNYVSPVEYFIILYLRLNSLNPDQETEIEKVRKIVYLWFKKSSFDWVDFPILEVLLEDFKEVLIELGRDDLAKPLGEQLVKTKRDVTRSIQHQVFNLDDTPPHPIFEEVNAINSIHDIDTLELARQLTLIESSIWRNIRAWEFVKGGWTKPNKDKLAPNIVMLTTRFNWVSAWVATEIIKGETKKARVATITKFIDVAEECLKLHNYNTIMEIISGFGNSSVHRMKDSFRSLSKAHRASLSNLRELMSDTGNFANLRKVIKSLKVPCVPFFGVYLTDITFILDGNEDYFEKKIINLSKAKKLDRVVSNLIKHQKPYKLLWVAHIRDYLLAVPVWDEDTLWKHSQYREPKEGREPVKPDEEKELFIDPITSYMPSLNVEAPNPPEFHDLDGTRSFSIERTRSHEVIPISLQQTTNPDKLGKLFGFNDFQVETQKQETGFGGLTNTLGNLSTSSAIQALVQTKKKKKTSSSLQGSGRNTVHISKNFHRVAKQDRSETVRVSPKVVNFFGIEESGIISPSSSPKSKAKSNRSKRKTDQSKKRGRRKLRKTVSESDSRSKKISTTKKDRDQKKDRESSSTRKKRRRRRKKGDKDKDKESTDKKRRRRKKVE